MAEIICERCGRQQPETSQLQECVYCGAALPAPPAEDGALLPPPAETPAETSAVEASADGWVSAAAAAAEQDVPEGKRRCAGCGELLYVEEKRCWRCGAELQEAEAAAPVEAGAAPEAPVAAPPVGVLPPVVAPPPAVAVPPYVPPTAAAPPVDAAAQNLAIWALVLSLLGMIGCPPLITSIIGIVLGAKARKQGASSLGVVAIVIGAIGVVIYSILLILMLIGILAADSVPSTPATSMHWGHTWLA